MEKRILSNMHERSGMIRRSGIDRRVTTRQIPCYLESLELEDVKQGFFERRQEPRRILDRRDLSL
jgi:hypothetical protein